jgi:DNA polymerase-3 subunit epsilon
MNGLRGPFLALDTETTGISVETDHIVTTCTALLTPPDGGGLWRQDVRSQLLAVEIDIPAGAEAVHGISTKFARDHGIDPTEGLNTAAEDLARALTAKIPVVGMNLFFDLTILDRELRRHALPTLDERLNHPIAPVIDVIVLDKQCDPYRKGSRKLVDLCAHYGVRIEGAHDSTADALAAARIAYRIGQIAGLSPQGVRDLRKAGRDWPVLDRVADEDVLYKYALLHTMTLMDLHAEQVGWRAYQQRSLAEHFRKQRRPFDDVDGAWPMRPFLVTDEAVLNV